MTEKWIIKNGEIVDTTNNMTFDSFMEIIIVLIISLVSHSIIFLSQIMSRYIVVRLL